MKSKNIVPLVCCIALPLVVGAISGYATSSNISSWYVFLNKPAFNPPNWIFAPVWTVLYILMGVSLYLIWRSPVRKNRSMALVVFLLQLLLNFAWSFIFFYFHQTGWALVEIEILWLSIVLMIGLFYKINKLATWLQVPYLCWVTFAAVLNGAIWYLNNN